MITIKNRMMMKNKKSDMISTRFLVYSVDLVKGKVTISQQNTSSNINNNEDNRTSFVLVKTFKTVQSPVLSYEWQMKTLEQTTSHTSQK